MKWGVFGIIGNTPKKNVTFWEKSETLTCFWWLQKFTFLLLVNIFSQVVTIQCSIVQWWLRLIHNSFFFNLGNNIEGLLTLCFAIVKIFAPVFACFGMQLYCSSWCILLYVSIMHKFAIVVRRHYSKNLVFALILFFPGTDSMMYAISLKFIFDSIFNICSVSSWQQHVDHSISWDWYIV